MDNSGKRCNFAKIMRKILLIACLALTALQMNAQTPKREVRAVWLTTLSNLDWPLTKATNPSTRERQKQQLCDILDKLAAANVNTVLLQTRIRATTLYPSDYEPWDACLTGKAGQDPGYDPLQFAIEQCHRRGMELHAWVVAIPVGKWKAAGCTQLNKRYPALVRKIGDEGFMNPEKAGTGDYIAKICREIVSRYDVDGIHLDYIRYPENWKQTVSKSEGRNYITQIVRRIHSAVKQEKPWVKVSCSPLGKFDNLSRYDSRGWNAYNTVCQDAQGWLREGIMDELFPMLYFRGDNFYPFAINWQENSHGRIIAPGLGIWLLSRNENNWPLTDITREIEVSRQLGMGHCYFRSRFFTDNTKGLYTHMKNQIDRYPALVPAMTWERNTAPEAPRDLKVTLSGEELHLQWPSGVDHSGGPYLTYNVYASRTCPVDIDDARNLIAGRLQSTELHLRGDDGQHYFAVTAMDRYGNESAAMQSHSISKGMTLLKNDGKKVKLPEGDLEVRNGDYLVVESMAGNILMTRIKTNDYLDIRRLKDGVYTLRVMNKHNKKHARRLGTFIIRR